MTDLDYRVYWLNRLGIVEDEEDPDVVLAFEFWFDADERNLFESIVDEVAEDTHGFTTEDEAKQFANGFQCGATAAGALEAETYWWGSESLAHLIVTCVDDDNYDELLALDATYVELATVLKRLGVLARVETLLEGLSPGGYDANGVPQLTPQQLTEFARLVTEEPPWVAIDLIVVDLGDKACTCSYGDSEEMTGHASLCPAVVSTTRIRF